MKMKAKIYYHDIGDYLSRDEKLAIVKKNRSIANMQWQVLAPNEHGDWLNQRNDAFSSFIPLGTREKAIRYRHNKGACPLVKRRHFLLCVRLFAQSQVPRNFCVRFEKDVAPSAAGR